MKPLDWIARLIYGALVWKERQRAKRVIGPERIQWPEGNKEQLELGARGETLVYWYLRAAGYKMIGRNRRPPRRWGELDMIGWDGNVLAFVEVKTRGREDTGPPETTVSRQQRKRIIHSAREYMKRLKRKPRAFRFDVAGVVWDPEAGYKVQVVKDAYRF